MQCIYFIFLKTRVTSLNSKQAWRVYCLFECFVCLFNWLVAIIDYWFGDVVSFSVVYIAYVKPFFILVWCLISVLVWVMYLFSFLKKGNTELIRFFVGHFWSTYISTLNYLFQQMSPGTLYPGRIHFWIWIIAEASIPSFWINIYFINN